MSEALERVRGVRELPVFPLPLVLFPGVPLPLHIFEPRYQKMLADVRASNNLFGLSNINAGIASVERPPAGHVGCAAEVIEVQALPEGRSNILTVGLVRYRLESYVETEEPYLVGRVEFFEDDAEDEELLARRTREVSELFMRIANAVRKLNDERAQLPALPDTGPERLSFLVAAALEIEPDEKQRLLELHSSFERLSHLRDMLAQAVAGYEERARMHGISKGNGHAGRKVDFGE